MTKRWKVLWLIKGLGRGGAEKLLETSLPYLNRETFEYQVAYFLTKKNELAPRFQQAGIPVHCLDTNAAYDLRVIGKLMDLLRREKFDILHIHSPYPAIIGRFAGRLTGVKAIVYTEHAITDSYRPATRLGNALTYPLNDAVIAISDAVGRSVARWKTIKARKIHTIHNAIDLNAFGPDGAALTDIRKEFSISPGDLIVGNVGHVKWQKGHRYLVQAARLVLEQYPGVTFLIVGGEKHQNGIRELEELSRELGIRGKLVFTGFRQDALRLMAGFDVFVLPSLQEGFGVVLLEAMALGKPVVGTKVGGVPEVIEDGANGFIVDAGSAEQIAEKILRLLRDRPLRRLMGDRGMALVRERFRAEDMVRSVEGIYLNVIEAKGIKKA